jgi:response regulator NasT
MPTRVIIADDETIQRMDLKDVLTKQGYLVVGEAGDGISAVNLAREIRPDLVIMDIRMPDMDGITAAETLTQEKIAPVLLLTAFGDQPLVERAKEAGVVNYIVKPLRESEVTPAIEIALARYSEFRALEDKARTLTEQLETRKIVERAKGLLMEKQGLSEQEAFRKIQKASMNNRKSMRSHPADERNVRIEINVFCDNRREHGYHRRHSFSSRGAHLLLRSSRGIVYNGSVCNC